VYSDIDGEQPYRRFSKKHNCHPYVHACICCVVRQGRLCASKAVVDSIALSKSMGFRGGGPDNQRQQLQGPKSGPLSLSVFGKRCRSLRVRTIFFLFAIATGWRCRVKDYPRPNCSGHCRKGSGRAAQVTFRPRRPGLARGPHRRDSPRDANRHCN
jgi:hypothetical protein